MTYTKFEELPVWRHALKVTKIVYDHTANEKWCKDFALRDQSRRAIISVSSNIVEGFEKNNNNEFIRYLRIAKGSVGELRSQMYIAKEVCYIDGDEFDSINSELEDLGRQIGGLIKYLEEFRRNN